MPGLHVARGGPEPSLDAEERVRLLLKGIDSLLDVRWVPTAAYNAQNRYYEGRYALISQWPSEDERWTLYRSGEIGEPFDALGWFCTDMHDAESVPVDVDSVERLVIELLGKCDNTRFPWRDRMAQMAEKNRQRRLQMKQPILDKAAEVAETLHHMVGTRKNATVERVMRELSEVPRDDA